MRVVASLCVIVALALAGFASGAAAESAQSLSAAAVRMRVIIDNDFGGDPDGLFALAHHLRSSSVEVCAIIGSRHYEDGFYGWPGSAEYGRQVASDLVQAMKLDNAPPVLAGAEKRMANVNTPTPSPGAAFIVKEGMREDRKTPLYVVCGASLNTIASAYLLEPKIASRLTVVWIGGPEYKGVALPPPGAQPTEYNLGIDVVAAQVVFNESKLSLWQVPRDAYRQPLISIAELRRRLHGAGEPDEFLVGHLEELLRRANGTLGEVYALGDSPLVLLTALQSSWEMDPSSSRYVLLPAPRISSTGTYEANPTGRTIRVYTQLDTRLLFEDMFAKLGRAE